MTQQDIVLGLIRAIIIVWFGLSLIGNTYALMFANYRKYPDMHYVLAVILGLTVMYFAWTL